MPFAFVTRNLVDMWGEPRFNSERVSQLLFGAVVEIGEKKAGYLRVRQADGYTGWVSEHLLKPVSAESAGQYNTGLNAIVTTLKLRTGGLIDRPVHFLYYGTRLSIKSWRGTILKAMLPDGSTVSVRRTGVRKISAETMKVTPQLLIREAKRFLGVNYLWGGISPAGVDCSGLMQTVFSRFNMAIPRDTKDQITIGRTVPRDGIRSGDLLFFDRHVGLAMGRDLMIHASVGAGGVQIESLSADKPNYRADLDKSFREGRRILP